MLKNWRQKRKREAEQRNLNQLNENIIRLRELFTQAMTNDLSLLPLLTRQLQYLHSKKRNVVAVMISSKTLDKLVGKVAKMDDPVLTNATFQNTLNFLVANEGKIATLVRLPVYINSLMDVPLHVIAEADFK